MTSELGVFRDLTHARKLLTCSDSSVVVARLTIGSEGAGRACCSCVAAAAGPLRELATELERTFEPGVWAWLATGIGGLRPAAFS